MKATRNLWLSIIFVAALVTGSVAALLVGIHPSLGLDLEGGVSVILAAPQGTPKSVMERALENIRQRVDAFGVGEPLLYLSGNNIEVQIPGLARGTIQPRAKDQYCLVGKDQQDFRQCFPSQAEAQKALDAIAVNPVVNSVCLTGDVWGDTAPCYPTTKDAKAAIDAISVVPVAQASTAPPSPSGSFCLNGTGLPQAPCSFATKKDANAALAAVGTDVSRQYCLQNADGSTLSSDQGTACFQAQDQATAALSGISAQHATQQFCAISSNGANQGCYLTRDAATARLQETGQERLLQVIGTTARLQERQVLQTLSPGSAEYKATPVTCGTQAQRETSACSFQALKDQTVVFLGQGPTDSATKYKLGPAKITGDMIKKATAVYNTGSQTQAATGWEIDFSLTSQGAKVFGEVTSELVNQSPPLNQLAIIVDNRIISSPVVQGAITGGNGVITGQFSQQRAQDLATQLNAGALPVNLKKQQVQTVSPTLGQESLHQGIIAGVVGLILLALYLLFYYRMLGIVAWFGMSIWAVLAIGLVAVAGRTLGYSLTLAGVAGLVISLGITADSYIVFFERLKDEVRHGKTPRAAVQPAFKRAYKTIVAADIVTALAALILYITAISSVRGFALTLGVATLLDLFVVYFFKRPVVFLIARSERLVNLHGFGLTSGVAAEPEPGELVPAGGAAK
ncbi:MAG TPA: protein translocase subunit SecD [Actinomycetota bacterium]|jgi:preprotein translocase subunit SecD|nr:protein translocase subunit SecD [Actinomycetota bacterium]